MIEYRFIDFKNNLIDRIVSDHKQEKTAIFFPSNKSRNLAMNALQKESGFKRIDLYTLEDLNKLALLNEKPLLQDAKRTLLFYQSLSDDIKSKYHLMDYFNSLNFMNQVLNLFSELSEENVQLEEINSTLIEQGYLSDWQMSFWQDLLSVRESYYNRLRDTNFADQIFLKLNIKSIEIFFSDYDNIVFANQFYFTNREKEVIKILAEKNLSVYMWYQFPEDLLDKTSLNVKPFMLQDLLPKKDKIDNKISIYNCPNDFVMLLEGIKIIENNNIKDIVDFDFYKNDWFSLLSNNKFNLPQSYSFENSELFNFMKILLNLFESRVYSNEAKKYFLPLQQVYKAFNYSYFYKYFFNTVNEDNNNKIQLAFRELALRNYLYFDAQCIDFITDDETVIALSNFNKLFNKLLSIQNLNNFIAVFDHNDGILLSKIINQDNLDKTDILEQFYEVLSNLSSIEELSIVQSWKEVFCKKPLIISILRFFLESVKGIMVSFKSENQGLISFNTLVDTRNLSYEKIIYFHLTEGILPKSKAIDFLFTEAQRKILGLKTYEDIRLREKYYFFRNILNTQESHLFCIENEDDNIEKSSFVEELLIYLKDNCTERNHIDTGYKPFFLELLKEQQHIKKNYNLDSKRLSKLEFYLLPSDINNDLGIEKKIVLNTYSLTELITDPMAWYINSHLKFKNLIQPETDRLNPKIIGIITHELIENLYRKKTKEYNKTLIFEKFLEAFNNEYLDEVYCDLIFKKNTLKFPHDFSGKYFHNILFPIVKKNLITFFEEKQFTDISRNSEVYMEYSIPETKLLTFNNISVFLRGKPDLLIQDEKKFFIIDFKTGKLQKEQLILYKYLIQQNFVTTQDLDFNLNFLSLINYESLSHQNHKDEDIEKIKDKLRLTLDLIFKHGYYYPENKTKRLNFEEISRINIFRKDKPDFWSDLGE